MGRGVDQKKLAEWKRRLARYERPGLTAVVFCKRERVSVAVLKYWRRQVELAALRSPGPTKPAPQVALFAPVEVIPRRWIVVWFPSAATLEIPDDRVDLVRLAIDRQGLRQAEALPICSRSSAAPCGTTATCSST